MTAFFIRTFVFQPFSIPSASSVPGMLPGDYVLVAKWRYGYSRLSFPAGLVPIAGKVLASPPRRGDLVVFKLPRDMDIDYLKRVVAFRVNAFK